MLTIKQKTFLSISGLIIFVVLSWPISLCLMAGIEYYFTKYELVSNPKQSPWVLITGVLFVIMYDIGSALNNAIEEYVEEN